MSIPGIGSVVAASLPLQRSQAPENFRTSRSVGAWLGLTTRRYQSGEVDFDGNISRRGDSHTAEPPLSSRDGNPHSKPCRQHASNPGGLQLRERGRFKRAAVAGARKLAVIMHTMLKTGERFDRSDPRERLRCKPRGMGDRP